MKYDTLEAQMDEELVSASSVIITNIVTELLVIFTSEERRSQMRKKCKPYCLP